MQRRAHPEGMQAGISRAEDEDACRCVNCQRKALQQVHPEAVGQHSMMKPSDIYKTSASLGHSSRHRSSREVSGQARLLLQMICRGTCWLMTE